MDKNIDKTKEYFLLLLFYVSMRLTGDTFNHQKKFYGIQKHIY